MRRPTNLDRAFQPATYARPEIASHIAQGAPPIKGAYAINSINKGPAKKKILVGFPIFCGPLILMGGCLKSEK